MKTPGEDLLERFINPSNYFPEHFGLMIVALVACRALDNEIAVENINRKYPPNIGGGRRRCTETIITTTADPEFRKVNGDVSLGFLDALCEELRK